MKSIRDERNNIDLGNKQMNDLLMRSIREIISRDAPNCLVSIPREQPTTDDTDATAVSKQRRKKWRVTRWDSAVMADATHGDVVFGAHVVDQVLVLITPPARAEPSSIRTDLAW